MSKISSISNNSRNNVPPTISRVPRFGMRHLQMILLLLMLTIAFGMRIQLAVAIVAMNDNTISPNPDIPTFNWTNKSVVLASFYWGYLTLQLVAGTLASKYGAKRFLIGAMIINSITCLLIPTAAIKFGSYGVVVCRILQGISQGFFYPSVYNLLGRWVPVSERSTLGSIALSGFTFGTFAGQPITGYMCSSWLGWPSTFYLYGSLGLIWTVVYIIFGASSPAEHRSIKVSERDYIEHSLGIEDEEEPSVTPWKEIFTSVPIFGLAIYNIGIVFGSVALQNETPIYMDKVLGFDIQTNSLLSAASSIAGFLAGFLFGFLADFLINNRYLSRVATRKIFCSITCVVSSIGLAALCFLPSDAKAGSVIMFIVIGSAYGASAGGPSVNQIDLSPRYAGIIMAVTNTCNATFAFIGPLLVQFIVRDETDKSQWQIFFYSAIGTYMMANIAFVLLGSADLQPWDSYGLDKSKRSTVDERRRKMSKKLSVAALGNV